MRDQRENDISGVRNLQDVIGQNTFPRAESHIIKSVHHYRPVFTPPSSIISHHAPPLQLRLQPPCPTSISTLLPQEQVILQRLSQRTLQSASVRPKSKPHYRLVGAPAIPPVYYRTFCQVEPVGAQ